MSKIKYMYLDIGQKFKVHMFLDFLLYACYFFFYPKYKKVTFFFSLTKVVTFLQLLFFLIFSLRLPSEVIPRTRGRLWCWAEGSGVEGLLNADPHLVIENMLCNDSSLRNGAWGTDWRHPRQASSLQPRDPDSRPATQHTASPLRHTTHSFPAPPSPHPVTWARLAPFLALLGFSSFLPENMVNTFLRARLSLSAAVCLRLSASAAERHVTHGMRTPTLKKHKVAI